MNSISETAEASVGLTGPELMRQLQAMRGTDNTTNFLYLLRAWTILAAVIGGTVWFVEYQHAAGSSIAYIAPVVLTAIVLVGAGQHQLAGLGHEAAHYILLRNRVIGELVSDWLCMFPLFASTQQYRQQHLAHHRAVNEPQRDPDLWQLQASGHDLAFPIAQRAFVCVLLKQLLIWNLVLYTLARSRYSAWALPATGGENHGRIPGSTRNTVQIVSWLGLLGFVYVAAGLQAAWPLAVGPLVWWLTATAMDLAFPATYRSGAAMQPVLSPRATSLVRMAFVALLFSALGWTARHTGRPVIMYYLLLWLVPIFTSFSFFMMLRQLVQHGNADRGWLTNTRVFLVNPFVRFAVFPIGQDYHLPHHMYATIPHYRLRGLHEFLLRYPSYAQNAVIVENYFMPGPRRTERPTVVDVLGPKFAPPIET